MIVKLESDTLAKTIFTLRDNLPIDEPTWASKLEFFEFSGMSDSEDEEV